MPFEELMPGKLGSGLTGHAPCDFVQPRTQRFSPMQRTGLASQHQEGCLEGILGMVLIAEHAPANAEYHRPVPFHQGSKRWLISPSGETLQELPIGDGASLWRRDQFLDVPDY
jgi:hypothetical protein